MAQVGQIVEGFSVLGQIPDDGRSLLYELGRGDERCQLKVLLPAATDREQESFLAAARLLMGLPAQPGLLAILGCGLLPDGSAYLIRRTPSGAPLPEGATSLSVSAKQELLAQLAAALAFLHTAGLVYHGLRPQQVWVSRDAEQTRVLLLDCAEVRRQDQDGPAAIPATMAGPHADAEWQAESSYLAPEYLSGFARPGAAADVYALGVLGYLLLAGKLPFSETGSRTRQVGQQATSLQKLLPTIPTAVAELVMSMLAESPDARPSAMRVAEVLRQRHPELPTHFGQYEVVRLLAEGGMGQVFDALDRQGQRRAAIKLMKPEIAQRPGFTERFMDEVRAPNIINDPGVITVLHRDQLPDGRPYIVMEFVEGTTLSDQLEKGPMPPDQVVRFGWLLATTLAKAHDKGVIHRDLKPDNIMVVPDGLVAGGVRTKILDFGIAKLREDLRGESLHHTQVGAAMGTPLYMAPEQWRDASSVSPKADVFALGRILQQMVTGQTPQDVKPIGETCPSWLALLVGRMQALDPAQRPSMQEVMAGLSRHVEQPALMAVSPPRSRARYWLFGGGGLVVLLGAAGLIGGLVKHGRSHKDAPQKSMTKVAAIPTKPATVTQLRERALALLTQALGNRNPEVRRQALAALTKTHDPRHRALVEQQLISDRHPLVQLQAAEALGQMGAQSSVRMLLDTVKDRAPDEVWVAVMRALQRLSQRPPSKATDQTVQQALQQALRSKEPIARSSTALLLAREDRAARAILREEYQRLLALSPQSPEALELLVGLANAGDVAALRELEGRLHAASGPSADPLALAMYLARRGDDRGEALLEQAAREEGAQALAAAQALSLLGNGLGCKHFRRVLRDGKAAEGTLILAADGLGICGTVADRELLGSLVELDSHPLLLRVTAAGSLLQLLGSDPGQSDQLAFGLYEEQGTTTASVALLGTMSSVEALKRLLTAVRDPATPVAVKRAAAATIPRVLQRIRKLDPKIEDVDLLHKLAEITTGIQSPDPVVRLLAVLALSEPQELIPALEDSDASVRLAAAQRIDTPRANQVLLEALQRGGNDGLLAYGVLRQRGGLPSDVAPPSLLAEFGNAEAARRVEMVAVLAHWSAADALPILWLAVRDGDIEVRRTLVATIGALAEQDASVLQLLRPLLRDPDALVHAQINQILAHRELSIESIPSVAESVPVPVVSAPLDMAAPPTAATPTKPGQVLLSGDEGVSVRVGRQELRLTKQPLQHELAPGSHRFSYVDASGKTVTQVLVVRSGEVTRVKVALSHASQSLGEAIALYQSGNYDGAFGKLIEAKRLGQERKIDPNFPTQLLGYLALVQDKKGMWLEAMGNYERFLREPIGLRSVELTTQVKAGIERLKARLGKVELHVRPTGTECQVRSLWLKPGGQDVLISGRRYRVDPEPGKTQIRPFDGCK